LCGCVIQQIHHHHPVDMGLVPMIEGILYVLSIALIIVMVIKFLIEIDLIDIERGK